MRWASDLIVEVGARFWEIQNAQPMLDPDLVAALVFDEIAEGSGGPEYVREILDDLIKESGPLELDQASPAQRHDWAGNNAAFTCLLCGKVFIVSAVLHPKGRVYPSCGDSKGHCTGGAKSGKRAYLT